MDGVVPLRGVKIKSYLLFTERYIVRISWTEGETKSVIWLLGWIMDYNLQAILN